MASGGESSDTTGAKQHNSKSSSSSSFEENIFNTPLQSIMDTFIMSLRDILAIYDRLLHVSHIYTGKIMFSIYLIFGHILLFNMLIALMVSTYDKTSEHKNEWIRQWAKMVLSLEQTLTKKEKIKQQNAYSHMLNNGEKALIVKWKNTRADYDKNKQAYEAFMKNLISNRH